MYLEIVALAIEPDLEDKKFNNVKVGKIIGNILRHHVRILERIKINISIKRIKY